MLLRVLIVVLGLSLGACSSSDKTLPPLDEGLGLESLDFEESSTNEFELEGEGKELAELEELDVLEEELEEKASNKEIVEDEFAFGDGGVDQKEEFSFEDFGEEGGDSKEGSLPGPVAEEETIEGGFQDFDFGDFNEEDTSLAEVEPQEVQEESFTPLEDEGGGAGDVADVDMEYIETSDPQDIGLANEVTSIDYNANQNGGSFVISTRGRPTIETEYVPETNQYILKVKEAKISKRLARPFLTKDFRQSFQSMNSYQDAQSGDVKFVFNLKQGSMPKVVPSQRGFIVEPGLRGMMGSVVGSEESQVGYQEGVDKAEVALSANDVEDFLLNKNKFVGQKISIQAKDEDIVNVIHFISEQVGANLVVSDDVKGKLSIKLKDVPWDQALVVIMKSKGLGYIRNGNILRLAPLETLQKESLAAAEIQKAKKTLEPFHVKVFPLSYAKPSVIESKIKSFLTPGTNGSLAGQVVSEERSSSVIVRDTLGVIKNVATLIKELDRPPLQVRIQAKVIEANKTFSKILESRFNATPSNRNNSGNFRISGALPFGKEADSTVTSFRPSVSISGINFLGTLTQSLRLNELDSNVRVLSSPTVLALNNEKATVLQSDEVLTRNRTISSNGETSTNIVRTPVELRLDVTPQVSSDGNVIMDLEVKRQFPDAAQDGTRPISSREAKTKVIVANNKTAMIGGVYQVLESKAESGIPMIRKWPLLKWLFNNQNYEKIDTELIIFVTPTIVNQFPYRASVQGEEIKQSEATSLKPSKIKTASKATQKPLLRKKSQL